MTVTDYESMTGEQVRSLCRSNSFDQTTAGIAHGYTQANLVVLPDELAADFETFCQNNPKPCPLLEMLEPGDYRPKILAHKADVRTDLPRYCVYKNGECVDEPASIKSYWQEKVGSSKAELTAFLIGCSFTFEAALIEAGIPIRHIEENVTVPMYKTNIQCTPSGPFAGPMVVSMRPMTEELANRAKRITSSFPRVHGAPINIGDPEKIGITDLSKPDFGDAVTIHEGEIPVFWACGVTPMVAIIQARLDFAITHKPGQMFVTDLMEESLRDPFF